MVGGGFTQKFFLLAFAGSSAWSQDARSITDLVACLNDKLVNHGAVNMSTAVEKCAPQGCKVTASMSTGSAQPACNVAGTQLPRIYLNCPGPTPGLRFRPTFTLCPVNANRIEAGEDVAPIAPSPAVPMQMANLGVPMNEAIVHQFTDYLNTSNNNLRCTRCHGNASPNATGDTPLLSSPFDPFTVTRRNLLPLVIFSSEPTRKALIAPSGTVAGQPVKAQTLDQICERIDSVLEGDPFAFGTGAPVQALCKALAGYTNKRSCGNGVPNVRCGGVTGGGIFVQNGVSSTVTLELSGQAEFDPDSPHRLAFQPNQMDATVSAFNSSTQTTVNAAALSELLEVEGRDGDGGEGDGNYAFTATGKGWVNGVSTAIVMRVSYSKAADVTQVALSNSDSGAFYAGGTAAGVRFTVTMTPIPPPAPADGDVTEPGSSRASRTHRTPR